MVAIPTVPDRLPYAAADDVLTDTMFLTPRSKVSPSRSARRNKSVCLLPHLQPVRSCLQPFLSARDATCLMRTSRSITLSLLSGYAIRDLDHARSYGGRTSAEIKRSIDLFSHYGIRVLAVCLPGQWMESLLEADNGYSILPASLVALTLGQVPLDPANGHNKRKSALHAFSDSLDSHRRCAKERTKNAKQNDSNADSDTVEFHSAMRPVSSYSCWDTAWDVMPYAHTSAPFNQPIPPGALPRGLRFLQFNDEYNQPLQVGSIPDKVEVLQFGEEFNQPLAIGHLPLSLTHLNLDWYYKHPLLPGVLPARLKRLRLGNMYFYPLQPGVLPPQLEQLSLGDYYHHPIPPGVIPSSVIHLRLSRDFNQPLQAGSIPEGVEYLDLGESFNQRLLPGVLPATLRELRMSRKFSWPPQPGSLPDGLEVLVFPLHSAYQHTLLPGVVPASVTTMSLSNTYAQELVSGAIAESVTWLRLPSCYVGRDLSDVLFSSTRVVWHDTA